MVDHVQFAALTTRQFGLFTRAQARAAGFTDAAIGRRLRSGEWILVAPGVFRVAATPLGWHGRVLAPCLGRSTVAAGRTAAVLHGLDPVAPWRPEVIVPRGHGRRLAGIQVHEVRDFDLRDEVRIGPIPTCGIGTTLFQLAGLVGRERTGAAMDDALRQRLADWPDLYRTLTLHARRGRKGSALYRAILDSRFGETVPDSRWNRQVADLLIDDGLPAPVLEHEILGPDGRLIGRVDLAWPGSRVAVELQSMRHHLNAHTFERDPLRRNALQRAGWIVLEFTWRYYVDHPVRLCAEVRDHLRARGRVD